MRLGIKTDDEFLIKLNEKNIQIQNNFLEKIKEIAKKHSVNVMLQDGAVKKQGGAARGQQKHQNTLGLLRRGAMPQRGNGDCGTRERHGCQEDQTDCGRWIVHHSEHVGASAARSPTRRQ